MTIFDSVLGRWHNGGTELELGAGVNAKSGIVATLNASTNRIDISVDADAVPVSGFSGSLSGETTLQGALDVVDATELMPSGSTGDVLSYVSGAWTASSAVLDVRASTFGAFGAPPVAQPSLNRGTASWMDVADALAELGWIELIGPWPT